MIDLIVPALSAEVESTGSFFNGVWLSTRVMPAERAACGGDWCETFVLSETVVALSIGDVSGHGSEQFEAMVAIRQAVRDAARRGLNPAGTLAAANRVVCGLVPRVHATAFLALLDTRRGTVTYANAGHPPPLMVGRFGSSFLADNVADLPLGIEPGLRPALRIATTPSSTLLVLYTDGVTEHDRRPVNGEAQLRKAATFAYRYSAPPSAFVIEELMFLTGHNRDDASILTAWTPRRPPATLRADAR